MKSKMPIIHNSEIRVACIIPTYNGRSELSRLLDSLDQQSTVFELFLVDSSSTDGTAELARSRVKNFQSIPSSEFNHGGTRQLIVDQNPEYEIYIFLTQDAYLEDSNAIQRLIEPFSDKNVGAVCGRQLPHIDASPLAQHARTFNYPSESSVKSLSDAPTLGLKTPFVSNSFTAYRKAALEKVGGFPNHVILSEDMFVAARMLLSGFTIAYSGSAQCRHSHDYTIIQEFRRYFDQGVFHGREAWIREHFGGAGGEGLRYVISELRFLGISRLHLWPTAVVRNTCKLLAYKLGQKEQYIPIKMKKQLGMYKGYWDSTHA